MSNSQKVERKLAAIMFTDIAGYAEQMSKDQDLAFVLLEEKQSKFKPLIKEHNGTLIKEMGDGRRVRQKIPQLSNCKTNYKRV